ncbi:hypothetical protein B0H16DRAFT_235025 [Mycena metata]|uniref:Uncharacterized protein n=1 Tax=Mycena metata TaxID=1033252 RepID=A0AAD7JQP0_9AGAR|nr:hypothetical protein B0H16DRAFT_235025 [Mycena metata]
MGSQPSDLSRGICLRLCPSGVGPYHIGPRRARVAATALYRSLCFVVKNGRQQSPATGWPICTKSVAMCLTHASDSVMLNFPKVLAANGTQFCGRIRRTTLQASLLMLLSLLCTYDGSRGSCSMYDNQRPWPLAMPSALRDRCCVFCTRSSLLYPRFPLTLFLSFYIFSASFTH